MRLFVAYELETSIKNKIGQIIEKLKEQTVSGSITNPEQLHLTLAFLGEVDDKKTVEIIELLNQFVFQRVELKTKGIHSFKQRKGRLYWLDFHENKQLLNIQLRLQQLLESNGFGIEDRKYQPHITLGRRILLKDKLIEPFESITVPCETIVLFKSKLTKQTVIHTKLHKINYS